MTTETLVAHAEVHVPVSPDRAFEYFTAQIDRWWKRGTMYWNDRERGERYEFRDGALREIYPDGEFVVGAIETWQPGELLVFGWSQSDWGVGSTRVEVRFRADADGTRVEIDHSGWEAVAGGEQMSTGYTHGWKEILGWFAAELGPNPL
jgi:uncharacterized protein YndB with AHSA1/START domain